MADQKSIRVVIFEDNKHYRESLYFIINGTPGYSCVGAWADCTDAIFQIKQSKPDVVLMDIEMPEMNGIDGVKKIKSEFRDLQILMQTVFDDDDNIFNAICAGASGYLLKNGTPSELINAINDVYQGGSPMSTNVARKVLQLFQKFAPVYPDNENYNLTSREKEILQLLVEGKSYKMIAVKYDIAYETVRSHMKHIYKKLHVESISEAILKVINQKII
ncbi:MAG: response regulator transcription factor [Fimbriimonadaceae bacterium]|nr:response regulator transcription factor [Chitinophagales bacterium]